MLREDGGRQQFSREVIRTVLRARSTGGPHLLGVVGSHVQDEACARSGGRGGLQRKDQTGKTDKGNVRAQGPEDGLCVAKYT